MKAGSDDRLCQIGILALKILPRVLESEVAKKIAMVCNVDYNFVAYPNVSEAKKFVESLLK